MTGTIFRVMRTAKTRTETACLIRSDNGPEEVFAHLREFVNPELMQEQMRVEFRIKLAQNGPRPEATDVVALTPEAA